MIKGHGDDIYNYEAVNANFSSNVCAKGPDESLVKHLEHTLNSLEHYPEPCADSLAQCLAEHHQLSTKKVLVCNGATEAFYLVANHYRGKKSLIFTPSFSEYEDACSSANHSMTFMENTLYAQVDYSDKDLVWFCNPNNPDAFIYDFRVLHGIIASHPTCLFIIDEAYIEFARGVQSFIPELVNYENILVIRSMTKRYAIPALRLGYMVGSASLMKSIMEHLMPWRLNSLAIEAGKFVLSPDYRDDFDAESDLRQCHLLQMELDKIAGIEVIASQATFFLAKSPMQASELKKRLVNDYGLLIRDASNFRGLSNYDFRVAVQSPSDNIRLVEALKDIFRND